MLTKADAEFFPEEKKILTLKEITGQTLKIAIPMGLSFTFTASEIAMAMMAVRIPKEDSDNHYLAAATLITTALNVTASIAMSPLYAMSILGSKQVGKLKRLEEGFNLEKREAIHTKIAGIFKAGLGLTAIITPLPFLALYFSNPILVHIFKQDPNIVSLVEELLSTYAFAIPGLMFRLTVEQMIFSYGKTLPAMFLALGSFAVGVGLAYFLAFGGPNLGLRGIGYGFLAEAYLSLLGFSLYLGCAKVFKDLPFLHKQFSLANLAKQLKNIVQLGLPITLQMIFELSATLAISVFAGLLGNDQLAAQSANTQLFVFSIIYSISFGQTIAQQVSRLIGEQDYKNAMRFSRYGLLITMVLSALINIPLAFFPQFTASIFSQNPSPRALQWSKGLIPLITTQTLYDTATYGMTQTLRATGDLNMPTFLKIFGLFAGLGLSYALGFGTYLNIYGIDIGFLIGVGFAAMLIFPRWLTGTSKESLMKESKPKSALTDIGWFRSKEKVNQRSERSVLLGSVDHSFEETESEALVYS